MTRLGPLEFDRALSCFRAGSLAEAEELCGQLLRRHRQHFNAWHLFGLIALQQSRLPEAIDRFRRSIAINPRQPAAQLNLSHALLRSAKPQAALSACEAALSQRSDYLEALTIKGNALLELNRPADALECYERALRQNPQSGELYINRGHALRNLGHYEQALSSYERAQQLRPLIAAARVGRAEVLYRLHRYEEALEESECAIKISPDDPETLRTRAQILLALKRSETALADFMRAIALDPHSSARFVDSGNALFHLGRITEAASSYERAVALSPGDFEALFNLGHALVRLGHDEQAVAVYDRAIALKPGFAKTYYHRGGALHRLGRLREAKSSYSHALSLDAQCGEALRGLGRVLQGLDRLPEALAYLDQAGKLDPESIEIKSSRAAVFMKLKQPDAAAECLTDLMRGDPQNADYEFALGRLMHARLLCADWREFDSNRAAIEAGVASDLRVTLPSLLTVFSESAALQLRCATGYVRDNWPTAATRSMQSFGHKRIRLAYVSADFREHPVSELMAGIVERHDREQFDIIGIALRPADGSDIGRRVTRAFDRYLDLSGRPDAEIAAKMRALEIDIAVDLTGYTEGQQPGIFAAGAAPVQIGFLGYPGTTAAPFMDYLVTDRIVIPPDQADLYSEKLIYLPDCFFPPPESPTPNPKLLRRIDHGLPGDGFVFCCFNNHHKILPGLFDVWMRLLVAVEGSVLWLSHGSEVVTTNLRREAIMRGVEPERLIFAPRLAALAEHLNRYQLADLVLDTLPYNAHKTAVDVLSAGAPLLTCLGSTFAGRVAASILSAHGLPQLVAQNFDQYEQLAISLATSRAPLREIRKQLARTELPGSVRNAGSYTRGLESAFQIVYRRTGRGEAPLSLEVPRVD